MPSLPSTPSLSNESKAASASRTDSPPPLPPSLPPALLPDEEGGGRGAEEEEGREEGGGRNARTWRSGVDRERAQPPVERRRRDWWKAGGREGWREGGREGGKGMSGCSETVPRSVAVPRSLPPSLPHLFLRKVVIVQQGQEGAGEGGWDGGWDRGRGGGRVVAAVREGEEGVGCGRRPVLLLLWVMAWREGGREGGKDREGETEWRGEKIEWHF